MKSKWSHEPCVCALSWCCSSNLVLSMLVTHIVYVWNVCVSYTFCNDEMGFYFMYSCYCYLPFIHLQILEVFFMYFKHIQNHIPNNISSYSQYHHKPRLKNDIISIHVEKCWNKRWNKIYNKGMWLLRTSQSNKKCETFILQTVFELKLWTLNIQVRRNCQTSIVS